MGQGSLTDEDKEQLNAVLKALEAFAARDDNKLAAAMVTVVRQHLRLGTAAGGALYIANMLREINSLNVWYSREVNIDFSELRQRLTDSVQRSNRTYDA